MANRFQIVAKAKLKKKANAAKAKKRGKRPKLPWKKSKDSAGTSLGAITEMTFKEFLVEARYHGQNVKYSAYINSWWTGSPTIGYIRLDDKTYHFREKSVAITTVQKEILERGQTAAQRLYAGRKANPEVAQKGLDLAKELIAKHKDDIVKVTGPTSFFDGVKTTFL